MKASVMQQNSPLMPAPSPFSRMAILEDRVVLSVEGTDAADFLHNLVTNHVERLTQDQACFAALLSPQGKILYEFFIIKTGDDEHPQYLLETSRALAGDLKQRLSMYKLRSKVSISLLESMAVAALWQEGHGQEKQIEAGQMEAGINPAPLNTDDEVLLYADPRLAALGHRLIGTPDALAKSAASLGGIQDMGAYHAHRITLEIPEGGKDYILGDTFPHEALYDQIHGVDFKKGCYIGQEVVSRMQHRGTARSRIMALTYACGFAADSGMEILSNGRPLGATGSSFGNKGLGLIRIDRLAEAIAANTPLTCGGLGLNAQIPAYATFSLPQIDTTLPAGT